MRAPLPSPRFWSQLAKSRERRSSSAYVIVASMHVNAGSDANSAQLLSCISATLACSRGSISAGTPGGYDLSQTFSMGLLSYTGSSTPKPEGSLARKSETQEKPEHTAEGPRPAVAESAQKIWPAGPGAFS